MEMDVTLLMDRDCPSPDLLPVREHAVRVVPPRGPEAFELVSFPILALMLCHDTKEVVRGKSRRRDGSEPTFGAVADRTALSGKKGSVKRLGTIANEPCAPFRTLTGRRRRRLSHSERL